MNETTSPERRMPKVRAPRFEFGEVPRFWFGDNPLTTHMANGANLLFPSGERFFIRSVRHFADQIADDPVLAEQVRRFYGQEAQHGAAHQRQFEELRAQGYDIDAFLRVYERVAWGWLEPRLSPELRLAITAALEHYTAIMAEGALGHGTLEPAHPRMQELLAWHAAEEIEHKAVAFDVLARVAPSYANRMIGLGVATVGLAAAWAFAATKLVATDVREGRAPKLGDLGALAHHQKRLGREVFAKGIRDYLRRDFHPNDRKDAHLAEAYLASAGLA